MAGMSPAAAFRIVPNAAPSIGNQRAVDDGRFHWILCQRFRRWLLLAVAVAEHFARNVVI